MDESPHYHCVDCGASLPSGVDSDSCRYCMYYCADCGKAAGYGAFDTECVDCIGPPTVLEGLLIALAPFYVFYFLLVRIPFLLLWRWPRAVAASLLRRR